MDKVEFCDVILNMDAEIAGILQVMLELDEDKANQVLECLRKYELILLAITGADEYVDTIGLPKEQVRANAERAYREWVLNR